MDLFRFFFTIYPKVVSCNYQCTKVTLSNVCYAVLKNTALVLSTDDVDDDDDDDDDDDELFLWYG